MRISHREMSDEDRDVDIESDDDGDLKNSGNFQTQAEKRAHHNALERKRRDHIKDSFSGLRDSVPSLQGEKVASRAQILKKAADYIQFMRRKNTTHQQDIDDLKRQNILLESQIRALEKAKSTGNFNTAAMMDAALITNPRGDAVSAFDGGSGSETSESSESSSNHQGRRNKKLKTSLTSGVGGAVGGSGGATEGDASPITSNNTTSSSGT